jgi:D-alanyl-D-alanine carboxypeptidase
MLLKRQHFFALIVLLALSVAVRADKVDDYIKSEMQRQHLPGLSLVVIKDQKIVKVQGYGLANIELSVPVTPETVFKIGSVSKQFIATGIMMLVQEGKLNLGDNIGEYLEGAPESWKPITIRHLLTHTSGIVREAPGFDPLKIQSDADVIKTAYPLPLRFAPGEKYEYCNVGYFTLAEIIRKVSGKPWGEYLSERLFKPLGMNSTRTTDMRDLVPNRANGYTWRDGKFQNAAIYLALRPSGAFLSTVTDLAKWEEALAKEKVLKQPVLDQMWTPVKLNNGKTEDYGFGWQLDDVRGHKLVNHGGSLPGFRAEFSRYVADKVTVIVLTNGDNANAFSIARGVANLYIPGLLPIRNVAGVDPKILDTYVGQYQGGQSPVLTIAREGNKLTIQQGSDSNKAELLPENQTDFFMIDQPYTTFSFVKDETGQLFFVRKVEGREASRVKKIK